MHVPEQAWEAWWRGTVTERSTKPVIGRTSERFRKAQMALWGSAYTDYDTAQLYAQMVSTKLSRLAK